MKTEITTTTQQLHVSKLPWERGELPQKKTDALGHTDTASRYPCFPPVCMITGANGNPALSVRPGSQGLSCQGPGHPWAEAAHRLLEGVGEEHRPEGGGCRNRERGKHTSSKRWADLLNVAAGMGCFLGPSTVISWGVIKMQTSLRKQSRGRKCSSSVRWSSQSLSASEPLH